MAIFYFWQSKWSIYVVCRCQLKKYTFVCTKVQRPICANELVVISDQERYHSCFWDLMSKDEAKLPLGSQYSFFLIGVLIRSEKHIVFAHLKVWHCWSVSWAEVGFCMLKWRMIKKKVTSERGAGVGEAKKKYSQATSGNIFVPASLWSIIRYLLSV